MTDNEIIKALECCGNLESDKACDECPFQDYSLYCGNELSKAALYLIDRQKAEIERLKEQLNTVAADKAVKEFTEILKNGAEQWIEQNT